MLEGITVISSWQVPTAWIILWLFGVFIGGWILYYSCQNESVLAAIIGGVLFAGCVAAMFFPTTLPMENRYKVLVDESVSLSDFNDRFEIMSQDGMALDIRERVPGEVVKPKY